MADQKHLDILRRGVSDWNKWRMANLGLRPNLSNAILTGEDLGGAELFEANLHGADLRSANLVRANLMAADLNDADIRFSDLTHAFLVAAHLRVSHMEGTKLTGANLQAAEFFATDLRKADFSNAEMGSTTFAEIDFSSTLGLETVMHHGPSTIGIDTIYRSHGQIPDIFLQRAGVPDSLIANISALISAMEPFQFYSCFISYSTNDQEFATLLYDDLTSKRVPCWFSPHDVQAGKKLNLQIDEAIRVHDKLLLILSADSINSNWVKSEIKKAAKRQALEKRDILFPISLIPYDELRNWECWDSDLGKDLAAEIREYLIPDFSHWKSPDLYQKAFDKLIRDLKAGKTKGTVTS